MPSNLLAAERFPLVRSRVFSIRVFSSSSTTSSRKKPLPTRCSTSASNFSFISCLSRIRQIPNALFQGVAPDRLHLLVTLAEPVFQFVRRDARTNARGIHNVGGHPRMHHRVRRRLAGRESQQGHNESDGDKQSAHQSETG